MERSLKPKTSAAAGNPRQERAGARNQGFRSPISLPARALSRCHLHLLLSPVRSNRFAEVSILTSLAMEMLLIMDVLLTLIGYGLICHTMWRDSGDGTLSSVVLGQYVIRLLACTSSLLHGSISVRPNIGEIVSSATGLLCFAFCIYIVFRRLPLLPFWLYLRLVVMLDVCISGLCFVIPLSWLPPGRLAALCLVSNIMVQLWSLFMLGESMYQHRQIDITTTMANTCLYSIRSVETFLPSTAGVHMIQNAAAGIVTLLQYLYWLVYAIRFSGADEVPHVVVAAPHVPH